VVCSLVTKVLLRTEQGSRLSTQNTRFFPLGFTVICQTIWLPYTRIMWNEHSDFVEQKLPAIVTDLKRDDLLVRCLAL